MLDSRLSLRLSNWGGAGDDSEFYRTAQKIYKEFETIHRVRLRIEGTPNPQDYITKLLLDFVSGSMPDVVTLDASSAAALIQNKALMDISPLVSQDSAFDISDFNPNVVKINQVGDSIFAIPIDYTPMVTYCNAKLFRESGVPLPRENWTFDEFLDIAKRLTIDGQYGFEFSNWMPGWVMFLWNNGADVLAPDGSRTQGFLTSKNAIESVQFLADLILKHKVAPNLSQVASTGVDYFATGKAAMKISGHWNLLTMSASKDVSMDDVVVTTMPTNVEVSHTVMYEAGCAIGVNCKHPELAWKYIKYFTSYEVQKLYNSSGVAVSARNDIVSEKLKANSSQGKRSEERLRLFLRATENARPPWGSRIEGYDRVEDHCQKALDAVLKNDVAVETALQRASHDIDKELAER